MGSDSISNANLSSFARDSAEKKKGSKLEKVKQNKVDVRTEQWISQVKSKASKMESDNTFLSTAPKPIENFKAQSNLPTRATRVDEIDHDHDHDHFASGNDFSQRTARRNRRRTVFCSSCSSKEGKKENLYNWEAMENVLPNLSEVILKGGRGAWAPDDRFRPRCLPRISTKQQQKKKPVVKSSNRWREMIGFKACSACPICCEDFDVTDSSFLPCTCGFRLCLFCHKRILEVDGRCPGCRKEYDFVHSGAGFQTESFTSRNSKRF